MLASICSSSELSLFDWQFFQSYSCEVKRKSQQHRQDHGPEYMKETDTLENLLGNLQEATILKEKQNVY